MANGNGIDWTKLSWRRPGCSGGVKLVVTGDWAPIRQSAERSTSSVSP